jgi:glutamate/tyrosine decarboxylase-like PLP-dependent enzyme
MVAGMGMKNMIQVPSDRMTGEMDCIALEKMVQEQVDKGKKPFFLNSVAGSTVMGSFDNHNKLNEICRNFGMWHHVDACWGGFLVFSP